MIQIPNQDPVTSADEFPTCKPRPQGLFQQYGKINQLQMDFTQLTDPSWSTALQCPGAIPLAQAEERAQAGCRGLCCQHQGPGQAGGETLWSFPLCLRAGTLLFWPCLNTTLGRAQEPGGAEVALPSCAISVPTAWHHTREHWDMALLQDQTLGADCEPTPYMCCARLGHWAQSPGSRAKGRDVSSWDPQEQEPESSRERHEIKSNTF